MRTGIKKSLESMPLLVVFALVSCADQEVDHSRPTESERKPLSQRLSETQGYTQDADGNWAPSSNKRSMYDSDRKYPFGQKNLTKDSYRTGDYKKKSWWGSKPYETQAYQGDTDGSRFQKRALQDGQVARQQGERSWLSKPFETQTLDTEAANESRVSDVERTRNDYTEAQDRTYRAPAIIDWRERREMSIEESRGILGR